MEVTFNQNLESDLDLAFASTVLKTQRGQTNQLSWIGS